MSHQTTVVLPVRDFDGMTRLASVLTVEERSVLIRELCNRSVSAVLGAELRAVVVSSSREVINWAGRSGLESVPDPGGGLSSAARGAVASLDGDPWIVLHTDIPDVTPDSLSHIARLAADGPVLVPSHDGGTNVIASRGSFPFSYGLGSFHRHLAATPHATIVTNAHLSIDIDTPLQLAAFPDLTTVSSHHGIQSL